MLNVKVITVGKLKEKYLRDACAEYEKRISRFANISIVELAECKLPDDPNEKQIEKALDTEADSIEKAMSGYIIPMCIEGKQMTSVQLSEKLQDIPLSGQSTVSFIIGSSFGLSDRIKSKADFKLSMSCMTFPHQLARVMLLEQIYRSLNISGGGKYHK